MNRPTLVRSAAAFAGLNRRTLVLGAAAASWPRRIAGANDRIRVAVVGTGTRGTRLVGNFLSHQDCEVPLVCDVFEPNRQRAVKAARGARGTPVEAIVDYRQALDRKDIDAIAIATPDHWHCPILIDACKAGKDVYVEKPLSNAIEPCLRAIEAVEAHHRVVQFGTQQRSCPHFQEAARIVRSGALGKVYHAAIFMPGGDGQPAAPPSDPPPGLDWEKFQGPARRHPYSVTRQHSWSSYYDYGGSTLTNWGAHLTDVVCWYLDDSPPLSATGSGAYARQGKPDPERFPDTFTASWSYEKFVMSYGNWAPGWPTPGIGIPQVGNFFAGTAGVMLVNRTGYMVRPPQGRSRAANQPSPVKPVEYRFTSERDAFEAMDKAHARNFLDCMRSRQKPVASIEVGFRATLPTLLGVLAIRHGKPYTWDGKQAKPLV